MLKGADLSQRVEFSASEDVKDPTIFVLKPISGIEMLGVAKHFGNGQATLSKEYIVDMLDLAIVEIKNPDIKDKEKINEFVLSLSPTVLMELVTEAGNINKFGAEEEKN